MNKLQILGFILITIGTIVSFIGSYNQSKKDNIFQDNLTEFVDKQISLDVPVLKVLRADNSNSIVVKNVGYKSAEKVKLIYSENSYPSAFKANAISVIEEIPQGVEVKIPLNLFSGINILTKVPNQDVEYQNKLIKELEDFKTGNKAFIPKFYLEYNFKNKEYLSDEYQIIVTNKGILHLSKSNPS